jgi:hypothetical protein
MHVTISKLCNKQNMKKTTADTQGPTFPVTANVTTKSHLQLRDPKEGTREPFLLENEEGREEEERSPPSSSARQGGRFSKRGEDDGVSFTTKITAASSIFSKEESLSLKKSSSRTSFQSQDLEEVESGDEYFSDDDDDQCIYDIFGPEAYEDFINGFGLKTSRERDIARKEFLREKYDILYKNRKAFPNQKGIPSVIKKPFYSVVRPTRDSNPKLHIPKRSFNYDSRTTNRSSTSVFERMNSTCVQKNIEGKKIRAKIHEKIVENEKRRNGELCRARGKISAEQGARLYHDFFAKKIQEEQQLFEHQKKLLMEEEQRQKQEKKISLDKALTFYYLEMMWLVRKERIIAENADKNGENYKPTMNLNQMLKYYMELQRHERDTVETLIGRKPFYD